MPGKVKVKILQGKNLPVMDRSSDTTDAYVEIKLGNTTYKTDVCRKSLNPQWNSEWYRFEVDDSELQDEPLQIRVMDHDTYSANDAIGKVYLNLNPLLLPAGGHLVKYGYNNEGNINHDNTKNSVMSGWIPVYDTMHGIRGEVNVIVKVELFSDFNKFRQSSCGVQFFCSPTVPHGYYAEVIHGFVEELIVNADPEYQWIDKIRTPRASNEARQTLFFKLSGELQRKIGVKALNLGGNAVIGFNQCFDLEGESGIVARGIGTAVTLVKVLDVNQLNDSANNEERALNYLKFVGCGKKFHLNVHPFKCNLLIPTPKPIYLQNSPCKITSRNQKLFKRNKHVLVTKSSPTLTMQTSLTSLLKQEDERGTPGSGISQRIKNLKYSSQSSLARKMTALKAKLGDSGIGEEHEVTVINPKKLLKQKKEFQRANSDSSVMAELLAKSVIDVHNSLTCILEGQHSESPHEGDTLEKLKPVSKLLSKCVSESNLSSNNKKDNLYINSDSSSSDDDEDDDEDDDTMDENQNIEEFDSISDIINKVHILEQHTEDKKLCTKRSISPLVIDNNEDSFDSIIEDKSERNQNKEDNVKVQSNILIAPVNAPNSIEKKTPVDTALQTMLLKKVNELGTYTPPTSPKSNYNSEISPLIMNIEDNKNQGSVDTAIQTMLLDKFNKVDPYTPSISQNSFNFVKPTEDMFFEVDLDKPVDLHTQEQIEEEKVLSENLKSPKRPGKLICPFEIQPNTVKNSLMNTAMQTTLLEKVNLLGTSTPPISSRQVFDFEPNVSHTRPDLLDNQSDSSSLISEKIKRIKHSQKRLSPSLTNINVKSSNLVNTAMRTMLMEKANLVETVGSEPISTEGFHFSKAPMEHHVEKHAEEKCTDSHVDNVKNNTLINAAMKTMLLDRVNIVESLKPPTSPVPADISSISEEFRSDSTKQNSTERDSSGNSSIHANHIKDHSLIDTAMQTMLLEKANLVETIGTDLISSEGFHFTEVPMESHHENETKSHIEENCKKQHVHSHSNSVKSNSLINAAMKTMLLDRVNIVESFTPPTSPVPADISSISEEFRSDSTKQSSTGRNSSGNSSIHANHIKDHSLIDTAMQTMLLEKANLVETIGTDPISSEGFHFTEVPMETYHENETKSHIEENCKEQHAHSHSNSVKSNSLINAAMKTMLLDRVNIVKSFTPPTSPIPADISSIPAEFREVPVKQRNIKRNVSHTDNVKDHSLVNTAMQTMLLEKANLLETIGTEPISPIGFHFVEGSSNIQEVAEKKTNNKELTSPLHTNHIENDSLNNTAMKTMSLDRENIVESFTTLTTPEPAVIPLISLEKFDKKTAEIKGIICPNPPDTEINNIDLFNTALQTVLLDKVNILGTYTPNNTSPEIKDDASVNSSHYEVRSNINYKEIVNKPILQKVANFNISPQGSSSSIPGSHIEQEQHETTNNCNISHDEININKKHSKILIPPIMIGANVKNTSLVNTAMQTILLDKVNILGTYTPPISPNLENTSLSSTSLLTLNKIKYQDVQAKAQRKLIKSTTSASFNEYLRKNDTVLGVPFTSITAIKKNLLKKQISHPCLYRIQEACIESNNSFQNDNKPTNVGETTNESNSPPGKSNKFKFFSMLMEKTRSNQFINETGKYMKSINVFKHKKIKSEKENVKSTRPKFLSMLHLHKKAANKNENHMQNQLDNKNNSQSSPCVLTITNLIETNTSCQPGNIEIEQGFCENNKQTCLTPFRNNTPPLSTYEHSQISRQSPEPPPRMSHSPGKFNNTATLPTCIYRRSSDSDLSITPKGNSLTGSDRSGGAANCNLNRNNIVLRSTIHQDNFDMLEYPFLTMTKFPLGFIVQLGGAISARSVKLLERNTNMEEPESRNDIWWSEIRMEIRSHARSLNCNAVLGYTETTSICEDVCVLSASGTAAVISFQYTEEVEENTQSLTKSHMTTSLDRNNFDKDKCIPKYIESNNRTLYESPEHLNSNPTTSNTVPQHFTACTLAHLPYDTNNVPVRVTVVKCGICMRGKVPDVLIATIEPPESIPSTGKGCFVESIINRPLKDLKGESLAKDISDGLPFLEYELQRLLINKLRIKGMNSIFGLKIRISIGEKMLIGIATGTAMFLTLLPSPLLPKLVSDRNADEKKLGDLKKRLRDTVKKNKETYQLKANTDSLQNYFMFPEYDDSEDELNSIDLLMGNKDCCILEIDDPQDAEVINLLMEDNPPDGFHVVNTETVPGLQDLEIVKNLQLFTQIYRAKISSSFNLHDYFRRLLQSLYFKLRRMVPCALCDLQFRVDLPEADEIQLCVIGMALGLGKHQVKLATTKKTDDELIFKLDEDQVLENSNSPKQPRHLQSHSTKQKQRSPSKTRHSVKLGHIPYKERHGVDITPLSYVPGGKIERYLGNLNFFFIRETTSIREEGGLSGFIHSFITEVLAIVRAHITALGGNAMVAYFLTEWVVNYNLHKNQGQCLINVGGDVVVVSYFDDDE